MNEIRKELEKLSKSEKILLLKTYNKNDINKLSVYLYNELVNVKHTMGSESSENKPIVDLSDLVSKKSIIRDAPAFIPSNIQEYSVNTYNYLLQNINNVKEQLNLNKGVFVDIPDNLLVLAFTANGNMLPQRVRYTLKTVYNSDNLEKLEFIGDTVLNTIVINYFMTDEKIWQSLTPHLGTQNKNNLVNNISLDCYMKEIGLCDFIITQKLGDKTCADVFEALIGALYYYLTINLKQGYYSLIHLHDWLFETFDFERKIYTSISGLRPCKI